MTTEQKEEILASMNNSNVSIPEETKYQVIDLADRMSELLASYNPDAKLFVLEAALVETVTSLNPILGSLFQRTIDEYKSKAHEIIQLLTALTEENNASRRVIGE